MICTNIEVSLGLYNGAKGTIKDIIYGLGESPPTIPDAVIIKLDNCSLPLDLCFNNEEGLVAIKPVQVSCSYNQNLVRTQIPLTISYAITAHKS
jgi:hypothetical protein